MCIDPTEIQRLILSNKIKGQIHLFCWNWRAVKSRQYGNIVYIVKSGNMEKKRQCGKEERNWDGEGW